MNEPHLVGRPLDLGIRHLARQDKLKLQAKLCRQDKLELQAKPCRQDKLKVQAKVHELPGAAPSCTRWVLVGLALSLLKYLTTQRCALALPFSPLLLTLSTILVSLEPAGQCGSVSDS